MSFWSRLPLGSTIAASMVTGTSMKVWRNAPLPSRTIVNSRNTSASIAIAMATMP